MRARTLGLLLALAPVAAAAETAAPLPPAPVRVVIPDVAAFDAALTGAYRRALRGEAGEDDRLAAAWRRSPVGAKLDRQWSLFARHLPWTWDEILKLKPRSLGLALLSVGSLESVLVLETPLAALPIAPPAGEARTHGGVSYHLVATGAADASPDPERRLGFAWARTGPWAHTGGWLFLATSERALLLALDEAREGRGVGPFLPGFVSLELDVTALRQDRYFRREFLFDAGSGEGRVTAALRLEGGRLVEVREGKGGPRTRGMAFDAPDAATAGWEPDGARLWPALRSALLEPIPSPADKPVPALVPLPPAAREATPDPYVVDLGKPPLATGPAAWEEGDLALWRSLWARRPPPGWGYFVGTDGARRIVFEWPASLQEELERTCRATVARRAGRAIVVPVGDVREIRVGPGLPALAWRRSGDFVWLAGKAADLDGLPALQPAPDLLRWARADLRAARAESGRWEKAEGPAAPERVRAFSDRILGVLDWMPATTTIAVERRRTGDGGWTERVVFETDSRQSTVDSRK